MAPALPGAFADSFLDGDIVADRREVWSARLAAPADSVTIVAESGAELVGFVHVALNADARWGSLLDNLHVVPQLHRRGVGKALVTRAAQAVLDKAASPAMFLWTLEQNVAAQGFYRAMGGTCVERARVNPPGGVPERLNGEPMRLRFLWPDAARLVPPPRPASAAGAAPRRSRWLRPRHSVEHDNNLMINQCKGVRCGV